MPLFDRAVRVTVGKPGAPDALQITDLRVGFTVGKDKTSTSNTAEIAIYNLSDATRNKIDSLDEQVMIEAGYSQAGGVKRLFLGDIVMVNHAHEPPDSVTRIQANDGGSALRGSTVSLSYAENTSALKILKDLVNSFKLPVRSLPDVKDRPYAHGFAAQGSAGDALDKVAARLGLEWSIQNGEIKVVIQGGLDGSEAILISPGTGLVGRVEKLEQSLDEADLAKIPPGWRVTSLLQPQVEPGGSIAIQSSDIPARSVFRVERVTHTGDTHGADWQSEIEVRVKLA